MKLLFAIALMVLTLAQTQTSSFDSSGLAIIEFTFKEELLKEERFRPNMVSDQPPVLNPDPNLLRVDKNESPIHARQREKERLSKMSTIGGVAHKDGPGKDVPTINRMVYIFYAKMKNDNSRPVARFVWAYQPSLETRGVPDLEYLCNVKIGPGETKNVKVVSSLPRQVAVVASASGDAPEFRKPALENMIINKVEFVDGTTWERPDWNKTILMTREGIKKLGKGKCLAL